MLRLKPSQEPCEPRPEGRRDVESPALTPGALAYAAAERARVIEQLKQLVRFPSTCGQTGHVTRCAEWLARHLRSVGLDTVSLLPGARHPIVLGEWRLAPGR